MRIKSRPLNLPKPLEYAVYRDGETIKFLCGPVVSYKEFEELCPEPKPPLEYGPNQEPKPDHSAPSHLKALNKHEDMRAAWMVLTSLAATPGLEWDTVDLQDCNTWLNYEEELSMSLTDMEKNALINRCYQANLPSLERDKEAHELFTQLLPQVAGASSSQTEEPSTLPSSTSASDGDTNPQAEK